jgi:hypothetical protein
MKQSILIIAAQHPCYVWRYTLDGDVLRIESTRGTGLQAYTFTAGITGWISEGEMRRTE